MINAKLRCAFGAALISSLLLATSCSSNGSAAAAAVDATSNASATVTTPAAATPPPPVTTTVVAAGLGGEADIADNFDANLWLEPGEAPHASPDEVRAFRFTCLARQVVRGGPTDTNSADYWAMGFDCMTRDVGNQVSLTGIQHTIADVLATGKCPAGSWLRVFLTFPACWDGKNMDVADHRSHMTFGTPAVG